jgi:hypothetical protein
MRNKNHGLTTLFFLHISQMRFNIRENRKKHELHCSPKNLRVIEKCTNMWWYVIESTLPSICDAIESMFYLFSSRYGCYLFSSFGVRMLFFISFYIYSLFTCILLICSCCLVAISNNRRSTRHRKVPRSAAVISSLNQRRSAMWCCADWVAVVVGCISCYLSNLACFVFPLEISRILKRNEEEDSGVFFNHSLIA